MTFDSDVRDPRYAAFYGPARDQKAAESQAAPPDQAFLDDWLLRTCDLVDRHRPQLVWFDWWIAQPAFQAHLQKFAAFYYNRGVEWKQGVAINYKKHGGESFPDSRRRPRRRARSARGHPPVLLADRHRRRQELVGLHHEPGLQDGGQPRRAISWTS